jgi:translation initiation factor 1 (eIF-1/SUI1)
LDFALIFTPSARVLIINGLTLRELTMADLKKAFENLKSNIADKVNDAVSLDVVTFSGNFNIKVGDVIGNDQNKFDLEKVLNSMKADVNAELNVVAYSTIKLDGDQVNIVKENLSSEQMELVKFHREMIEASQNSRKAIVDMIKGLV